MTRFLRGQFQQWSWRIYNLVKITHQCHNQCVRNKGAQCNWADMMMSGVCWAQAVTNTYMPYLSVHFYIVLWYFRSYENHTDRFDKNDCSYFRWSYWIMVTHTCTHSINVQILWAIVNSKNQAKNKLFKLKMA